MLVKTLSLRLLGGLVLLSMLPVLSFGENPPAKPIDKALAPHDEGGEILSEFQSLEFPYIDRRIIPSDSGDGEVSLKEVEMLGHPGRIALHLRNPLDKDVEIIVPELEVSFRVPARTERVYEMVDNAVGYHREVAYTVRILEGTKLVQTDRSDLLSDLIRRNQVVYVPPPDDEPPPPVRRAPEKRVPVRGYW